MAKELETVFHRVEIVIPGDAKTAYTRLCNALASMETPGETVVWTTDLFTEREADTGKITRVRRMDELAVE